MDLDFDIFDVPREDHFGAAIVEQTLAALLELYPEAPVIPLREDAVSAPMPDSIPLRDNPVVRTRSALSLIVYESDIAVAWDRTLRSGMASCRYRLAKVPDMVGTNYMFDLRENHGVMLSVSVMESADELGRSPIESEDLEVIYTPRFATVVKDVGSIIARIDEAVTQILGWEPGELVGRRSVDIIHPDDHSLAVDNWMAMLGAAGPGRRVRLRHQHKDGTWIWFEVTNHNRLDDPDEPCVVAEMVDITEEMAALEELRAREGLLDRLAEAIPVGLLQIDAGRQVVYTNDRLHQIVGHVRAETVDAQLETIHDTDRIVLHEALTEVLGGTPHADFEVQLTPVPGDEPRSCTVSLRALSSEPGAVTGAIICITDITDSARMREELRRRATFDELTGCHNRASIMSALEANIDSGQRRAERAVVYVDVDRFKAVNDEYGHAVGDALLRVVSERLRGAVREGDVVGRLGGDEFLIVCPEIGGAEAAMALADRIASAVRTESVDVDNGSIAAQVSVGVAWSSGDGLAADALVARADRAMYESKRERIGMPKLAVAA